MAFYPGTRSMLVPYTGLHARSTNKAALLHTNGGGAQLYPFWVQHARAGNHVGAQYQVFWDGTSQGYVDPSMVIYHAFSASEFAIGIETQDDGDNTRPWTLPQMTTIAAILHFHEVPPVMLTSPDPADGVGYHSLETVWNKDNHDCTGSVRQKQIPTVLSLLAGLYVIPTPAPVRRRSGDDMAIIIHSPANDAGGRGAALIIDGVGHPLSSATWSAWNEIQSVDAAAVSIDFISSASYDALVPKTAAMEAPLLLQDGVLVHDHHEP